MHRAMISRSRRYIRPFNKDLWAVSFGWFVRALGFGISIPFISIYFHSRMGLSIAQIGLFFGFMAVVRSFFQALGGELSDHVERRQILIFSQVLRAAAFMLLSISIYQQWGFLAISIFLLINSILGRLCLLGRFRTALRRIDFRLFRRSPRPCADGYLFAGAGFRGRLSDIFKKTARPV